MLLTIRNIRLSYLALVVIFFGCIQRSKKSQKVDAEAITELVVYCENEMIQPLLELSENFERDNHCRIKIQNDCSQNLIGLINYSNTGDLFIPSSLHAFQALRSKSGIFITDSVFLGYNKLVFMVKKGNPKEYTGNLARLTSKDLALIIANPETSSLGFETRKALKERNMYDEVLKHVVALTTDSKGLLKSLKNDQADVVINWESTIHVNGSDKYIDLVPFDLDNEYTADIFAGVLSTSNEKTLARSFLSMVDTPTGKSILRKYGFSKRKTLIF